MEIWKQKNTKNVIAMQERVHAILKFYNVGTDSTLDNSGEVARMGRSRIFSWAMEIITGSFICSVIVRIGKDILLKYK